MQWHAFMWKNKRYKNEKEAIAQKKIQCDSLFESCSVFMSAGPYKNCSCMSAYSVDAQKMADAVGMVCWADDSDVRFFTQILFHED